ncbi:MAG: hypothetical protein ACHQ7N_19295 [Candidatus Methylomirabilales bacterium]
MSEDGRRLGHSRPVGESHLAEESGRGGRRSPRREFHTETRRRVEQRQPPGPPSRTAREAWIDVLATIIAEEVLDDQKPEKANQTSEW